ncbi:MAG: ArnT family glycosyltransferase [Crocinitomicaceae bacterium]
MDKISQYINKNRWIEWLLFAVVFWLCIVNLHLNRGLNDMIPGYHYWRKTDTYAQIMNYYFNGLNFFDHGIYYNQMNSGGKAVAEFPLFYYLVAIQKTIFGNHDIILKINWLVVMFFGQFALFKIALDYTKNYLLSLIVPLALFLSPTYVIYCIEFLPDPIALHFGFIGFYFLSSYFRRKRNESLVFALLFFSLSGMMKPFFLVPYIAFLITYFIYILLQKQKLKQIVIWLIPFGMVALWFLYVGWYNQSVKSHYFLAKLKPIWNETLENRESIWSKIETKWLSTYFHEGYYWVIIVIAIITILLSERKNWTNRIFFIFSLLGSVTFFTLLFGMLRQHDYYIFPLLFLVPLTLLYFANTVRLKFNKWVSYSLGTLLLLGVYLGSTNSWHERNRRLRVPRINAVENFTPYLGLDSFLNRHGVGVDDFIFAFSDKSPTYALMLMNRKGWSGFQTYYKAFTAEKLMNMGAKYAIINKALPQKKDSLAFENVTLQYVADTNQIFIYKLFK